MKIRERERLHQRAAELSAMFAGAGWTPTVENFKPREFVKRYGTPDDGWWTVGGTRPDGRNCTKSCQTEQEILDFLNEAPAPKVKEAVLALDELRPAFSARPPASVVVSDPADKARIAELEEKLAACEAALAPVQDKLQARPDTPDTGYEYGAGEKKIPEKFAAHMREGETLASAQQRLLRDWWAELGRLRNAHGTVEENLDREQEIEDLISLAAQLGELS